MVLGAAGRAQLAALREALSVRAGEVGVEGGGDAASSLLYAVAKSRQDSLALTIQLGERDQSVRAGLVIG